MNPVSRCWAEISSSALRHNFAFLRGSLPASIRIMAVVKADAYGHSANIVVPCLSEEADAFGVANLAEARAIAQLANERPIFILSPALPDERETIARHRFIPFVSCVDEARHYASFGTPDAPVEIHLTIDTGMGRIGIPAHVAHATLREVACIPSVAITGINSHFPSADENPTFTQQQIHRWEEIVAFAKPLFPALRTIHIANSAGSLAFPPGSCNLVRAGLALYGASPLPEFQQALRPVLNWKTRISLVRELPAGHGISSGSTFVTPTPMRIATLAAGYADGYHRRLSNQNACIIIRETRCPILGRVTMDQIMADVSHLPEAIPGDEALLMGQTPSQLAIPASELAQKAGTIPWEIFTSIAKRTNRIATP
jgi:alanine racemase